jgi:hypothetical protein
MSDAIEDAFNQALASMDTVSREYQLKRRAVVDEYVSEANAETARYQAALAMISARYETTEQVLLAEYHEKQKQS